MLFEWDSNDQAWQFWSKKTRERIKDPKKRDILVPKEAPHAWGTKRPSLEQNFYEVMDQPNNDVVDIKNNPVVEVKENGLVTEDGQFREFDIIALATGFDAVTGGMKNMGLKDINGVDVNDKWAEGTKTYLGMTMAGYPNHFFLYGAQGPTAFSNGPSCVELQGEWIVDAIAKLRKEGIKYLDATKEGEDKWFNMVKEINDKTLFPYTNSWYMGELEAITEKLNVRLMCSTGANIPGKIREQLNFPGGFPKYEQETRDVLNNGFKHFVTEPPAAAA
jgi:cation diffusion facilitator CzcD-associated flavoprotein CzcO